VFVDVDRTPDEAVTVYKTSKLDKYWRNESWKVLYDPGTDILTVILKEGVPVVESDEDKPGVVLDYDDERNLLSLENLDASRQVTDTRKVEYQSR
jgi:uncharacterized protein YuzE